MIRQALLTLTLALMVGGFLLIWDSPPESFIRQKGDQFEKNPRADSYMEEITSRRFSDKGSEKFSLSSPRIEFFEGSSILTIDEPVFLTSSPLGRPLELQASQGQLDSALGMLDLDGNVRADINSRGELARLTTEHLTYFIDTNIALTDSSFKLLAPQNNVSGSGLHIDLIKEIFTIKSKVRVTHEPI
jgi:LPS export ABC transporter protein LptC